MTTTAECAEHAIAALQRILDAVKAAPAPLDDADLPTESTNVGGVPMRFKSTKGAVRIEIEGHDMGIEFDRKDVRSIAGIARGPVVWTTLTNLRSALDGVVPQMVVADGLEDNVIAPALDPEQQKALDDALNAAKAWCIDGSIEIGHRATFTFRLGASRADLEPPVTWKYSSDNGLVVHEVLLAAIGPSIERPSLILPSQAVNAVTARRKRGDPPFGYARVGPMRSASRTDTQMDPITAMRLVAAASERISPHGHSLSDLFLATTVAKPEIDMSAAEPVRTRNFTWPKSFPAGAEHELEDLGVEPLLAYHITHKLMRADDRSGHRMPSFSPRQVGRYTRWFDAPPGTPGSAISLSQGIVEMLGNLELLFEYDGCILPQPLFHNRIVASCISQGGEDGDVLLGLPLTKMEGWRPFAYGMIDLRETPVYVDRATGADGFRVQRRDAGIKPGSPVLPGIRVRDAIWIDYSTMSDEWRSIKPEHVPAAWRGLALTERMLGVRTMNMVRALYAMDRAQMEPLDTSAWIDHSSSLGGLAHAIVTES